MISPPEQLRRAKLALMSGSPPTHVGQKDSGPTCPCWLGVIGLAAVGLAMIRWPRLRRAVWPWMVRCAWSRLGANMPRIGTSSTMVAGP
ncbi:MAG: hypothetical protein IT442_00390 [Phycisphaeraceae bacterium]|nr:hypothetical protein [Phycisphaeraceae bacterium]